MLGLRRIGSCGLLWRRVSDPYIAEVLVFVTLGSLNCVSD